VNAADKKPRRKGVRTISQILRTGDFVLMIGDKITGGPFLTWAEAKEALIKSGASNDS
jgi:hypothetical protein